MRPPRTPPCRAVLGCLVAIAAVGCTSDFRWDPPPGHPARLDASLMPPPATRSPADHRPPSPAAAPSGDRDGGMDMPEREGRGHGRRDGDRGDGGHEDASHPGDPGADRGGTPDPEDDAHARS